jgi:hypothetical protein
MRYIWKHKRPWIVKAILSKKSNAGGITRPDFELYYKAITLKTYGIDTKTSRKYNGIEDPDINPCIYSQVIFDKGAQNTWWRKDSLFNKCCWENWISICRRLKLDPYLSPYTKINSKRIKDLNIRPETLKLLQEVVGNTLELISIENDILSTTQKAQHLWERMSKWGCIKLKKLLYSKRNSH